MTEEITALNKTISDFLGLPIILAGGKARRRPYISHNLIKLRNENEQATFITKKVYNQSLRTINFLDNYPIDLEVQYKLLFDNEDPRFLSCPFDLYRYLKSYDTISNFRAIGFSISLLSDIVMPTVNKLEEWEKQAIIDVKISLLQTEQKKIETIEAVRSTRSEFN